MKMNPRMLVRIVAVVVVVAGLGWQWWGRHHAPAPGTETGIPASAASAHAKPVKPAAAVTLRLGALTLPACEL